MLGPLPTVYRLLVGACVLISFAGIGAWLTYRIPGPLYASGGALLGAAAGALVVLLLLHDFDGVAAEDQRRR